MRIRRFFTILEQRVTGCIKFNTSTREVIPQWLFNEDAEDDASYWGENDRYWEVIDMYHGKGETGTDDMNTDTKI